MTIGKRIMTMNKDLWIERNNQLNCDWSAKTVQYCRNIFDSIDPPDGKIVMLGAAYSLALEVLYNKFGNRTVGVDKWNFGNHPRCIERDIFELEDFDCAFVYCDVASFSHIALDDPCPRLTAFDWSMRNLVQGGYCITRMYGYTARDKASTQMLLDIASKYSVEIGPLPQEYIGNGWHSRDDVLIKKKG
jgi:hypothetical protein